MNDRILLRLINLIRDFLALTTDALTNDVGEQGMQDGAKLSIALIQERLTDIRKAAEDLLAELDGRDG